jgi:hypothetical protein
MATRYTHKTYDRYGERGCHFCGTCYADAMTTHACDATTCKACGLRQCMGHGLGHGACGICLVGILGGWGGAERACGYKGCAEPAIAEAPRVRNVCASHFERAYKQTLETLRASALRDSAQYDDADYHFREIS